MRVTKQNVEMECKKDDLCKGYLGDIVGKVNDEKDCNKIETFYLCKSFKKVSSSDPKKCHWVKLFSKNQCGIISI